MAIKPHLPWLDYTVQGGESSRTINPGEEQEYRKLLDEYLYHRQRIHHTKDLNKSIMCAACGFYEHRLVLLTEDPEDGYHI